MNIKPGDVFGRLTILSFAFRNRFRYGHWHCICACGEYRIVREANLKNGNTKSCGCLKIELATIHGLRKIPEYEVWAKMIQRCYNPNASGYKYYGGRGITVCKRWKDSYLAFYEDMRRRPSSKHSIERINNDGNYEPGNCKWAMRKEQRRNSRQIRIIEFNGQSMCLTDWAVETGISVSGLRFRLGAGWSIERALTTKVQR